MKLNKLGLVLIIIVAIGVLGVGYFFFVGPPAFGPPPTIEVIQPTNREKSVVSGQSIIIIAAAYGELGVERIDLLENDVVIGSHHPAQTQSIGFSTPFSWFGSQVGQHDLTLIAYDNKGQASEPQTVLVAVYPQEVVQFDGIPNNIPMDEFVMVEPKTPDSENGGNNSSGNANDNAGSANDNAGGNTDSNNSNNDSADNTVDPNTGDADAVDPNNTNDNSDGEDRDNGGQGDPLDPDDSNRSDNPIAPFDDVPPPEPADEPPTVVSFSYSLEFVGGVFNVFYTIETQDDIGIDFIDVGLLGPLGEAFGVLESCDMVGDICRTEGQIVLASGEWIISARAFDTSGQASAPETIIVEVLGGELGEPPAAIEHDNDWWDWFADHFGNFEFPIFDLGFDLADIAGAFGGEEEPPSAGRQDWCAVLSGQPDGGFIDVTVEMRCDLTVEEGHFLLLKMERRVLHIGDGGHSFGPLGWFDETRTTLSNGEIFTWQDSDALCNNAFEYRVRISEAYREGDDILISEDLVLASKRLNSVGCLLNTISGDLNLRVESDDGLSTRVLWEIEETELPADPIYENGLLVELVRTSEVVDEQIVLQSGILSPAELAAGVFFDYEDNDLACAVEYWYSVNIIAAGAERPPSLAAGWLVQQSKRGNIKPCAGGDLDSFDINFSTYWHNDFYYNALAEVRIPADFEISGTLKMEIQYFTPDFGRCGSPPCDGVWNVRQVNRVTAPDQVIEFTHSLSCGAHETQVRFALFRVIPPNLDREYLSYSVPNVFMPDNCPPPTPEIISIEATTANCPQGVDRCVIVHYEPYTQPNQEGVNIATNLVLERQTQGVFTRFNLNMDLDTFIDTNPTTPIENHAPNAPRCNPPSMYRLLAVDEFGHWYGASPLVFYGLACDGVWNEYAER